MSRESYEAWEAEQGISPVSPEAHYAEKAWNAALAALRVELVLDYDEEGNSLLDNPTLTDAISKIATEEAGHEH